MKEFFESLFGSYKGRYKNKFIGTFFLFYLILNWKKVVVILFISDMSYKDFIFHWSDDIHSTLIVVGWAFILACLYLAISPWLSFVVHVAQSKAITEYKIQTIRNDIKVIEEKEKLEGIKGELLQKERVNMNLELKNSRASKDMSIFNGIKSGLSEQSLLDMYFDLERKQVISTAMFDKIKYFVHNLSAAENIFTNDRLMVASDDMKKVFSLLLDDLKKYKGIGINGYEYATSVIDQILHDKKDVIESYRKFISESNSVLFG